MTQTIRAQSISIKTATMERRSLLLVLSLFLSIVTACGGNQYLNENYKRQTKENPKIAFIPFYGENAGLSDTLTDIMFKDSLNPDFYFSVFESRKQIEKNPALETAASKLVSKEYGKDDLKKDPGINDLVTDEELSLLKTSFGGSNLLMVPVRFFAGMHLGRVYGVNVFRLYDLENGKLVYQREVNLNTTYVNKDSYKMIAISSMAVAREEFSKFYESPHLKK